MKAFFCVSDVCMALSNVFEHLNYCLAENCFGLFYSFCEKKKKSQPNYVFGENLCFY